jgi:hypothetical protein
MTDLQTPHALIVNPNDVAVNSEWAPDIATCLQERSLNGEMTTRPIKEDIQ